VKLPFLESVCFGSTPHSAAAHPKANQAPSGQRPPFKFRNPKTPTNGAPFLGRLGRLRSPGASRWRETGKPTRRPSWSPSTPHRRYKTPAPPFRLPSPRTHKAHALFPPDRNLFLSPDSARSYCFLPRGNAAFESLISEFPRIAESSLDFDGSFWVGSVRFGGFFSGGRESNPGFPPIFFAC
jgi:hypothetical protein